MTGFPWLQASWQRLMQAHRQGRLGHALLLSGPPGIGKRAFARDLAAALLCERAGAAGGACGQCRACTLFASGGHPDYQRIEPEEPGKAIRIDAVREMIQRMSLASHYGGLRVTILDPTEAMNQHAANSLLKTLEEPPAGNLIVLISERPALLSATIRSRCQMVKLPRPTPAQGLDWLARQADNTGVARAELETRLALADWAPLAAQAVAQDSQSNARQAQQDLLALSRGQAAVVDVAERWLKQATGEPIHWLYQWLSDMARLANGIEAPRLQEPGGGALQGLAGSVNLSGLYRLHDKVVQALRSEQGNLNAQLQLEALLTQWLDLFADKPVTRS